MAKNPPEGMNRVTPYLYYEDVGAAVDWLSKSFGFSERAGDRITGPDGQVVHTSVALQDGVVLMGRPPDYENPKRGHPVHHLLYVFVDDADAHCAAARAAGARITSEPEDAFYGDRRYSAADCEGHHWTFATHVRDLSPEEIAKAAGGP